MNGSLHVLNLLRATVAVFIVLSLALTWIAIEVGVPYRVGGMGDAETVAGDALLRGTGISAPGAFLIGFAVLLALTWLPAPWRAIPAFLLVVAATVGIIAGIAEIPLGSGPFAQDIGWGGILLWLLSMAAAVLMIGLGLVAGLRSVRGVAATEDRP